MSELTFEEKQQKSIETLCEASRLIQQGRTYLLLAKRYNTMNVVEQLKRHLRRILRYNWRK